MCVQTHEDAAGQSDLQVLCWHPAPLHGDGLQYPLLVD